MCAKTFLQWMSEDNDKAFADGTSRGLAGAGETVKRRLVFGIKLYGLGVGFRRPGLVAAVLIDQRLVGPAFGNRAVELDRRVEIVEGIVIIAERDVGNAAAVIGLGASGCSEIAVEKSSIACLC